MARPALRYPIITGDPDVEINRVVHPMRCRRGAGSNGRRRASTAVVVCAGRIASRPWPTRRPRAPVTCRGCAPVYRQAEDESSPASNSIKRNSRMAASRPSSKPWEAPGGALVPALSLQQRPPCPSPPRQNPPRRRRHRPSPPLKRPRHPLPDTEPPPALVQVLTCS